MATTTPNFGWSVPTSSDLVKNGATAIETLGDSIDASLVDLKGGTTGQVLAKASGTDMDFSWVAQDDSNAIQNAIVDAKGDLIAATANDTPARLAVGTDYKILTADSTEATGMKWTGDWIAYTPTWTASTTNPAIGNGSLTGAYRRIGQQVDFYADLSIGSTTTTGTGIWRISLPVVAVNAQWNFSYDVWILDSGVKWWIGYVGEGVSSGFTDKFEIWNPTFTTQVSSTHPMVWGANDGARITGSYRVG
jgi:hypothetical protein